MTTKDFLKRTPIVKDWVKRLNNLTERTEFVKKQLSALPGGAVILDAGCGSQQFRPYCSHLSYRAQDFGQYVSDQKQIIGSSAGGVGGEKGYDYGKLDYVGDIWSIAEKDGTFDAVLCTEVFEHIPYPIETLREFSRLLKSGGTLILTAPSNCLRHMDPYYFYSGFSDRWFERFLNDAGFEPVSIEPVGDYFSWLGVEVARTAMASSFLAKIALLPALLYYLSKRKTALSVDTLCMGYHVVAKKR